MNYDFVDFHADGSGETAVAKTGRPTAVVKDEFLGNGVELIGGNTGCDPLGHFGEGAAGEVACATHQFDFFRCLEIDHLLFS